MRKITLSLILLCFLSACLNQVTPVTEGKDINLAIVDYPTGELYTNIDEFRLEVEVENRAKNPVQGLLCISDSLSDNFGGIPSGDCQDVMLEKAEEIEGEIYPQKTTFFFPRGSKASYKYTQIPQEEISESISISSSFQYELTTIASTKVCLKNPLLKEDEISLSCPKEIIISDIKQDQTPLMIDSIEQTINTISNSEVKLNLKIKILQEEPGILLSYNQPYYQEIEELYPLIGFKVLLDNQDVFNCIGLKGNSVEIKESETVIKCSSTIPVTQDFIEKRLDIHLGYSFKLRTEPIQIKLKKGE
ncbi:MAG TPA: hypothetical protein VJB89_02810 [Candidatus Nanoarchaeia archaeon]|nr:hypothetical protein [Candidatus Nanoarchaeia archaeon]